MRFFDAHSHIHDKDFDAGREAVLSRMRAANVATITVGTYLESSRKAVGLAEKEPDVWATVGLHPTDLPAQSGTAKPFVEEEYRKLVEHPRVVAVGECGLDYFWQKEERERQKQRENFAKQIEMAISINKPLMLHARPSRGTADAYEDVLRIITDNQQLTTNNIRGNIHFFVGDKTIAKQFLDIGFTLSFTGVITFARDYDEVIKYIPLQSILAETDSPYVAPVPYRGKRNEPAFVVEVAQMIAEIKGLPLGLVSETLYSNVKKAFNLPTLPA